MSKKNIILATTCVVIVVVVSFELLLLETPTVQTATVNDVISNPSAWVNKAAIFIGVLNLLYPPLSENIPWNFSFTSGDQSIGVAVGRDVNLVGFENSSLFTYVRIYGIVQEGEITFKSSLRPPETAYFIEAITIERLVPMLWHY
jgi:hypothetical protein